MKLSLVNCLAIAVLTASVAPAPAALGNEASNATGFCQGALPAFDTQIRKRPLAVRNEGTAIAFVSCSIPVNYAGNNIFVAAYLVNRNAGAVVVDCTFVDGVVAEFNNPGLPAYYPKSTAAAAGVPTQVSWDAVDFGIASFSNIANLNCALPPGVEITVLVAAE